MFADDANRFCSHKKLTSLQENINSELINIHTWLCANKLSLNIEKSNYVIFHPSQRKLPVSVRLILNDKQLEKEKCIKYHGILN